ncbi:CPBP family intramembrane glutamic endopeptidase [Tenacibaculum insulae]|uniref:CPBP family intramembrane glutamic endopeptidase n=1 Tax=Tenacibaculum insulae TaxID=2029677 RepID=UPI003AB3555B
MKFIDNLKLTYGENFPNKIKFSLRDLFALLIIPLIAISSLVFMKIFDDKYTMGLADSLFRGLLFIIVCVLYSKLLKKNWVRFNQSKFASWTLVILGAIVIQIIITLTRSFLPSVPITETIQPEEILEVNLTYLIISLGPVFTSLLEDVVFRYTLLYKLFIKNTLFRITIVILNSVLFGLIHYYNFDGHIVSTVSFMTAGLFLNLIFIWTRNIWHVLLIHAVNNFVLSTLALIVLYIFQTVLK